MKNKKKFRELMEEIEVLVNSLESGQLDLEEGIQAYKQGVGILREAKERLKKIEHEFKIIKDQE